MSRSIRLPVLIPSAAFRNTVARKLFPVLATSRKPSPFRSAEVTLNVLPGAFAHITSPTWALIRLLPLDKPIE
jgi:hypothetical protein